MNPVLYGKEHIIYLIVSFSVTIILLFVIKKYVKREKTLIIIAKLTGILLLAAVMLNRASVMVKDGETNLLHLLPTTFCGCASTFLALGAIFLKKDNFIYHSILYLALVGGTATLFYPDFIGQAPSVFYLPTISGLLHHSIHLFLALYLILTRQVYPTLKKYFYLPLGLCCLMTLGIFEINALKFSGCMEIGREFISGTRLTWYSVGAIFLVLHFFFLLTFDVLRKKEKYNKPYKNNIRKA